MWISKIIKKHRVTPMNTEHVINNIKPEFVTQKQTYKKIFQENDGITIELHNERIVYITYEINSFTFNMQNKYGEKLSFDLTGHALYIPNRCSACGYGSDDWFFYSQNTNVYAILNFSVNGACGAMWGYKQISKNELTLLIKENSVDNLSKIWFDKQKNFIGGLHPVSIDAAKKIIIPNYSHCRRITDIEYYGN